MPRIIVTTEASELPEQASVLLYEQVHSVHLSTGHAAAQLLQRLAWAISDAEDAEGTHVEQHKEPSRRSPGIPLAVRADARLPVGVSATPVI